MTQALIAFALLTGCVNRLRLVATAALQPRLRRPVPAGRRRRRPFRRPLPPASGAGAGLRRRSAGVQPVTARPDRFRPAPPAASIARFASAGFTPGCDLSRGSRMPVCTIVSDCAQIVIFSH